MAYLKFATGLVKDKIWGEVPGFLGDEDLGLLYHLLRQGAAMALVQIGHDEDTQPAASLARLQHQIVQVCRT